MSQSIKNTAPQRYHITLIRIAITKETGKNILEDVEKLEYKLE